MKTTRKSPRRILIGLFIALPVGAGATTIVVGDSTGAPAPADNAVHIQSAAPWHSGSPPTTGLSVSVGAGNEASSYSSVALGTDNHAFGDYSVAVGASNQAAGQLGTGIAVGMGNYVGTWEEGTSLAFGADNYVGGGSASSYDSMTFGLRNGLNYSPHSAAFGHDVSINNADGVYAVGSNIIITSTFGAYGTGRDIFMDHADNSYAAGLNLTIETTSASAFGSGITNSVGGSTMIGPSDAAKVTILSSGNVGIGLGTTPPSEKLEVGGNAKINGSLTTTGAFSPGGSINLASGQTITFSNEGNAVSISSPGSHRMQFGVGGNAFEARLGGLMFPIGNKIMDQNANTMLAFGYASPAVNYVQIDNSITGVAPTIRSAGTDANIGLILAPKGTGNISIPTGLVGINTAAPRNKLDVTGSSSATYGGRNIFGDDGNYNPLIKQHRWTGVNSNYYTSSITTTGDGTGGALLKFQVGSTMAPLGSETLAEVMILRGNGKVGVGTIPADPLHVKGIARIEGSNPEYMVKIDPNGAVLNQHASGESFFYGLQLGSTYASQQPIFKAQTSNANGSANSFFGGYSSTGTKVFNVNANGAIYSNALSGSGNALLAADPSGNIVRSNAASENTYKIQGQIISGQTLSPQYGRATPAQANTVGLELRAGQSSPPPALAFHHELVSTTYLQAQGSPRALRITSGANETASGLIVDGNVGVGTTSPQATLHVQAPAPTDGGKAFRVVDSGFPATPANSSSHALGQVQISPVANNSAVVSLGRRSAGSNSSGFELGTLLFNGSGTDGATFRKASSITAIAKTDNWGNATAPTDLAISVNAGTSQMDQMTEVMRISSDKSVGIGTATPAAKLDVNGTVQIAGNVTVKNAAVIRISPAGDIGMGAFTSGANPQL